MIKQETKTLSKPNKHTNRKDKTMAEYTFDNHSEAPLSDSDMIDIAIEQYKKEYGHNREIKAAFCAGLDVYIVAPNGDIYKSETFDRNSGYLDLYGSIDCLTNISDLMSALRLIERVKSFQ